MFHNHTITDKKTNWRKGFFQQHNNNNKKCIFYSIRLLQRFKNVGIKKTYHEFLFTRYRSKIEN